MTSKIKVDNIENQCGGAVVTKCGATTTISGSVVKADDIQAADGGNLINQCGTTITLGASGDTINLASGASQTGFGRTGTVDWDTTPKTATFSAVSGNGYFVNTTSGAITVNLPAGSAGAIVSLADYAATWQTNNVTVSPNGSDKIGSLNSNATLETEGQSVTFVYVDSTQGWINTMDSTSNVRGTPPFIVATGGTITCCGDYKIHKFTGPGTFTVTNAGTPAGSDSVDYLVVAGGGGGGTGSPVNFAGGGGAGGFRLNTALPVSVQGYSIAVGGGGPSGNNGNNSVFSSITSTAGGAGGNGGGPVGDAGSPGGSGGGGGSSNIAPETGPTANPGGTGNTPPVSPPQGNNGGFGQHQPGVAGQQGGGGGAGQTGFNGCIPATPTSGDGGDGSPATPVFGASPKPFYGPTNGVYAGGGGGMGCNAGTGGTGGGGNGVPGGGTAGATNTGGGGGNGASGGSGIVLIRYKYQ
jgi:hypothetical protein